MKVILILSICVVLLDMAVGQASSGGATINEATTFCEDAVPSYCVSTTCPQYCNALRSRRQRSSCNSGCTKTQRCKLKPVGAADDPTNRILDAQNRDQLYACIAEKRDPAGKTTGRRMTPWRDLRTSSFRRATRP